MDILLTVLPFITGLVISLITIPGVRWISSRSGLVAAPRPDRWHARPTPLLGGVSIYLGFIATVLLQYLIHPDLGVEWSIVIAGSLIFLLGLIDDFRNISPPAKLIGQIFAASIVVIFGRNINFFPYETLNIAFTFLWLVGISNAINLLDNMDGLAAGVALIAAGLLSYLFWQAGRPELLMFTLAIAGSALGFLLFNFPPATIFMGDSGSLFLGFALAALAIARVPRASNVLAVLGVPTMLFLLPILDTTLVTITRVLRGQSPAQGGKDHTSHRLIAFGLSERQAVLSLYVVTLIAGIAGTAIESLDYSISLLLIPILIFALTLFTANLGRLKIIDSPKRSTSRAITKLVIKLTARTRLLEISLDFLLISISYYLAFWTFSSFQLTDSQFSLFTQTMPIAVVSAYTAFFIFGIYRGVWMFVSMRDLMMFGFSSAGSLPLLYLAIITLLQPEEYSLSIILLFGIFLFLGLAASRASFRIFDQLFPSAAQPVDKQQRILIIGADQSSELVLRWLNMQSKTYLPVGFIDDDPFKQGRQIHGIQVVGGIDDVLEAGKKLRIHGVIIPFESDITNPMNRTMIQQCKDENIWVRQINIQLDEIE